MIKNESLILKHIRIYFIPILVLLAVLLYFYLGSFFQVGVDYYGSFLQENIHSEDNPMRLYTGKTPDGKVVLKTMTMNQTDKLIEVSLNEKVREYVIETSSDEQLIRLFDENNALIFWGNLDREKGTLSPAGQDAVHYYTYEPVLNDQFNLENPDPMLLVILANNLNERYRGNLSMLIFAVLILASLIIDVIFPDFFFRMKNLKFKGEIEVPELYKKMQRISWILSPVILLIILYAAL